MISNVPTHHSTSTFSMHTVWVGPIGHTALVLYYYIVTLLLLLTYDDDDNMTYQYHFLLPRLDAHTVLFLPRGPRPSTDCLILIVLNAHCLLRDARASPKL